MHSGHFLYENGSFLGKKDGSSKVPSQQFVLISRHKNVISMEKTENAVARLAVRLPYVARWGEALWLRYRWDAGDEGLVAMTWSEGHVWEATLDSPGATAAVVSWEYEVRTPDGTAVAGRLVRREANPLRRLRLVRGTTLVSDSWSEVGVGVIYHHVAFTSCLFSPQNGTPCHSLPSSTRCALHLSALPAPSGLRWGIVGSTPGLGAWDARHAVPLQRTDVYMWSCVLDIAEARAGFDYKIVLIDESNGGHVLWEEGSNRRHSALSDAYAASSVMLLASSPRFPQVPLWRGAGVVIPVFSLRSAGSWGAGDFGDLKTLVRWAAGTDMKAIQILPVNDTTRRGTWEDSYPYSGISVFALHPLYLDPREWAGTELFRQFAVEGERLNALESMDYEGTFRLKHRFLLALYEQEGCRVRARRDFRAFVEQNAHWLRPYADFRAAQELGGTAAFHVFVQFLLHRQLRDAHEEARRSGVILKGDIPIGISRDSVPARVDPHLFHFDGQAGAPPDDFARDGQNWGFPTYNWEAMAEDGFAWWRSRFAHMGEYFDAYRIDHVLGFFRIWEIPTSQVFGTLGHFRPALPLSEEEIGAFGFTLPPADYAVPRFDAATYEGMCQEAGQPLDAYVVRCGDVSMLRREVGTQRAILARVEDNNVKRVLMHAVADVLFLEDKDSPGHYHPRVGAQSTPTFRRLSREMQDAFNRLHDDFFYRRHNAFWAAEAMRKLPAILAPRPGERTLLPCAEDLGMVPASVKDVLNTLSVLSLEIQSMPKQYGVRFADLSQNPYLSVTTISTHDMPPLRLWWAQDAERAQAYWHEALGHDGEAPREATSELCEEIVRQHLASPSMLCLLAFQDWLAIDGTLRRTDPDEQINVPADPHHYWRYRMHLTLEQLFAATAFNERLRTLIHAAGR